MEKLTLIKSRTALIVIWTSLLVLLEGLFIRYCYRAVLTRGLSTPDTIVSTGLVALAIGAFLVLAFYIVYEELDSDYSVILFSALLLMAVGIAIPYFTFEYRYYIIGVTVFEEYEVYLGIINMANIIVVLASLCWFLFSGIALSTMLRAAKRN